MRHAPAEDEEVSLSVLHAPAPHYPRLQLRKLSQSVDDMRRCKQSRPDRTFLQLSVIMCKFGTTRLTCSTRPTDQQFTSSSLPYKATRQLPTSSNKKGQPRIAVVSSISVGSSHAIGPSCMAPPRQSLPSSEAPPRGSRRQRLTDTTVRQSAVCEDLH